MYSYTITLKYYFMYSSDSILALFLFPSFSLLDVLCDPTDLIWRKGILFEVMTGHTAFIDSLLAVLRQANARISVHSPQDHFIITLSLATDMTDVTLRASGLWLGTRTGVGGIATLA